MNEDSAKRGVEAVEAFIRTFNAQDHERHAETLNYPHIRFANGKFTTIENADAFIAGSRRGEARSPLRVLERQSAVRAQLADRLTVAAEKKLDAARSRLSENMHALHIASPMATLERGYSITHIGDSEAPLMSAMRVRQGDELRTRFSDGIAISVVTQTESMRQNSKRKKLS